MSWFEISSPIILEVTGKDSRRYLNARLTNDIRTLKQGGVIKAAALNPQGKTEALFTILCRSDEDFILYTDGGDAAKVIPAFKRYIVADRVAVKDSSASFSLFHTIKISLALSIVGAGAFLEIDGTIGVSSIRTPNSGIDLIVPKDKVEETKAILQKAGPALTNEERTVARIQSGHPEFPTEIREEMLFSEAGLTEAISYTKGCYAGQEVMERIDSQGRSPKKMIRIKVPNKIEFPAGEPIKNEEGASVGEVLISAYDAAKNETLMFAVLKNKPELEAAPLKVKEIPATYL